MDAGIISHALVFLHLLISDIAKCIARGCLLLFYKNYIVYYNVYCYYCGVFIEKYVCTKFHHYYYWLLSYTAIYVPIVLRLVYCCFTRTTLFTKLFTCLYAQSLRLLSHHQVFYSTLSEIAKCITRGCLLLFYKNYIVYYNIYC